MLHLTSKVFSRNLFTPLAHSHTLLQRTPFHFKRAAKIRMLQLPAKGFLNKNVKDQRNARLVRVSEHGSSKFKLQGAVVRRQVQSSSFNVEGYSTCSRNKPCGGTEKLARVQSLEPMISRKALISIRLRPTFNMVETKPLTMPLRNRSPLTR